MAGGLTLFVSFSAYAGEWKEDSMGWWYQNDDGNFPMNTWQEIDGKSYYFGADGYMLSNTVTPDGYTVDASGAWDQSVAPKEGTQKTETEAYEKRELDKAMYAKTFSHMPGWECIWYNGDIYKIEVTKAVIKYMDGTSDTLSSLGITLFHDKTFD